MISLDKNKGFVYIWRDFQSHPFWNEKPFTRAQAWIDLILLANHEDVKTFKDGCIQLFKRGTINRSLYSLAERWGWDRKKVRSFLKLLETEKMATTVRTTRGTTITLVNYDVYQNNRTTPSPTDGTTPSPTVGLVLPTNNNDNNKITKNKRNIVRHKYGEYNNVLLSDEELKKLQEEYPTQYTAKLEALSDYMKSTGKSYKDHYATIRNWIRREGGAQHGNNSDIRTGEKGKTFNLEDYL